MSEYMIGTRIGYLHACNALRWEVATGCDNAEDVCAVKDVQGVDCCWAAMDPMDDYCTTCDRQIESPGPLVIHCDTATCRSRRAEGFAPTFHPDALDALKRLRRPRNIAVGLVGDFTCLPVEQRMQIWRAMLEDERHLYITITKAPERLTEDELQIMAKIGERLWFGVSLTGDEERHHIIGMALRRDLLWYAAIRYWASVEPILGPAAGLGVGFGFPFVALGALTDGKGRVVPVAEGGSKPEDLEEWREWAGPDAWLKRGYHKHGYVNRVPDKWMARAKGGASDE